jgi:hypothetical protein
MMTNLLQNLDQQRLLFDTAPPANRVTDEGGIELSLELARNGYVVIGGVKNVEAAIQRGYSAIAHLGARHELRHLGLHGVQLAKADRIPVCETFVRSDFQCLHFDYGLPVLPVPGGQIWYAFSLLWMPPSASGSGVRTRILKLCDLSPVLQKLTSSAAIERLRAYTQAHGDGWLRPAPVNTGRIAALVRWLDGMLGTRYFSNLVEADSATFFENGEQLSADENLRRETEALSLFGVRLGDVEHNVVLQPGELLILDNTVLAHGRLGQRPPGEVWQLLFGLVGLEPARLHAILERAAKALGCA